MPLARRSPLMLSIAGTLGLHLMPGTSGPRPSVMRVFTWGSPVEEVGRSGQRALCLAQSEWIGAQVGSPASVCVDSRICSPLRVSSSCGGILVNLLKLCCQLPFGGVGGRRSGMALSPLFRKTMTRRLMLPAVQ